MDTYHTVLYLHLLSLLAGIAAASIATLSLFRLRAAETLMEAVPWGMLAGKVGKVFPLVLVGFFATGAYMTSDVWTWETGWIDVGIVSLAIIAIQGPLIAKNRAKLLEKALKENGPGPLGEPARRLTRDPALWVASLSNPAIVLGVAWVMTQKPSTAGAMVAVLVAYAIGAGVALRFARSNPLQPYGASRRLMATGGFAAVGSKELRGRVQRSATRDSSPVTASQ